ncbi:MAG: 3',5'-nucleoside bisphosphate phosphatase [Lautropia sp.]
MNDLSRPSLHPDPCRLNVDLHCHSVASDGTLAPVEVVRRAHANGVQALALTDHDDLGGLDAAAAEATRLGLCFIPGVEVSVTWADETIHVVGLRIDPADRALREGLAAIRDGREERAHRMSTSLEAAGIANARAGAMRYVGNPDLISRSHFARYIVEAGFCSEVREVFARYLTPGKPGYVAHRWATLATAVGLIRGAGGVAVLAHPARYRLGDTARWALAEEFREAGGAAIEVLSGSHTKADFERFADWCKTLSMPASRGSDFHDPDESNYDIGALPPMPDSLTPVWWDWPELRHLEPAFT